MERRDRRRARGRGRATGWRSLAIGCVVGVLVGSAGVAGGMAAAARTAVVIAQGADITGGDPYKTTSTYDFNVISNIYETLITRDAGLHLKPGLAVSWRALDPTTWEFKLRPGVRFQDGEPLTAQVVKFSIDRALDPRLHWSRALWYPPISAVSVVDPATVRIVTKVPMSATNFLQRMAVNSWIVPPGYLAKNGDDALVQRPIGTGPYKLAQWVRDDHVELVANPDYWGGRPKIDDIIFRAIPNDSSRLAELLAGSVDMINLIPPSLFPPVQRAPRAKLVQGASLSLFFVHFNLVNIPQGRPLADKRVRQALNYAVARRALLTGVMHDAGAPIATFCTALQFGCDMSVPGWPYDPDRAKALLAAAGYPNGFDMTIATSSGTYPGDRDITVSVADQLSRVGVRARPMVVEYGVLLQQLVAKKITADAALFRHTSFWAYGGELAESSFSSQGGVASWTPADPEYERALDSAERSTDDAAAKGFLRQAQLLFRDDAPAISLFTAPNAYGMSRDLDWTPRPDLLLLMADASWK